MAIKKKNPASSKDASITLEIRGNEGTSIRASIDVLTSNEDLIDTLEKATPEDIEGVLQCIIQNVRNFDYLNVTLSK